MILSFVEIIKRPLKALIEQFFKYLANATAVYPLKNSRSFRAGYFDANREDSLLLSPYGTESYIVSCKDRVIGRRLFSSGRFEFENFEKMLPLLGTDFKRKLLIDVGANIGVISIPAVKRGFFEKAIAIEPEPRNYSLLVANIHINGLANRIDARNCALGDGSLSIVQMGLSDDNFGDHRIATDKREAFEDMLSRKTIEVSCFSLDENIGPIDPRSTLIWMDTQGFEGFVLAGAKKALQHNPPLVIEFWPYGWDQSNCFPSFKEAIYNAGYRWFYDLSKPQSRRQITADSFDKLYEESGFRGHVFTDLLILR